MDVIAYSQRLVGRVRPVSQGVVRRSEATASSAYRLETEAVIAHEGVFRESGTLIASGGELRLRTIGTGLLVDAVGGGRLGNVTWEVDGGTGRWANASGRISSTFVQNAAGDVVDEQHGFLVLLETPLTIGGSP